MDYQQQELLASIKLENEPQLYVTHSVNIPGRTLAIVCAHNDLDPKQGGSLYEIEPNEMLIEKYPNLCITPMIHNVDVHRTKHLPLVVINLATDDINLSKGESMGFLHIQPLEISEIITETSTEPLSITYEDNINWVLQETEGEVKKENIEKKFITYPADIEVHRKIELQDADISMNNDKFSKPYVWNLKIYFRQIQVIMEKHLCWKLKLTLVIACQSPKNPILFL